jgi:hypothetical protein
LHVNAHGAGNRAHRAAPDTEFANGIAQFGMRAEGTSVRRRLYVKWIV